MAVIPRLRMADYLCAGAAGHFHRSPLTGPRPHRHDFAEVFWIDGGRGWYWIDGRRLETEVGMLYLVTPADVHTYEAMPGTAAHLVNLALPLARVRMAVSTWCPEDDPLARPAMKRMCQVGASGLARLRTAAAALYAGRRDGRAVDQLLLTALDMLMGTGSEGQAPPWLTAALEQVRRSQCIGGVSGLARLCHRSREHVARACREYLGRSPTEVLDGMRMDRASDLMASTDLPIATVGERCGLRGRAHFYRRFRLAHGVTPAVWRQRSRALLGH